MKKQTKAVLVHSLAMYDAMKSLAKREKMDKGVTYLVFRGKVTEVYAALSISQSYYSSVMTILEHNGCIEQLQSGSRNVESVYLVNQRPKNADALTIPADLKDSGPKPLTDHPAFAKLSDRVEGLETLVGGIDIGKALVELDGRLRKIGA